MPSFQAFFAASLNNNNSRVPSKLQHQDAHVTPVWCPLFSQGMLSVGLFVEVDPIEDLTSGRSGVFVSGDFYLLGVQLLACVVIAIWSGTVSFCLLYVSIHNSCFHSFGTKTQTNSKMK